MGDTFSQAFGRNINRLRTSAGITQEGLAEKADISRRFLQEIEAGEKQPTVKTAAKLRFALNCTWDRLFEALPGPFEDTIG